MIRRRIALLLAAALVSLTGLVAVLSEGRPADETYGPLFGANTTYPYFASGKVESLACDDGATFDSETASVLAEACLLAYVRDPAFIASTLDRVGFDSVSFFEDAGVFGFLANSDTASMLVFRGTEAWDWSDIATNMQIGMTSFALDGRAHLGFAKALRRVEDAILEALMALPLERQNVPLWLAGHSLGGALATLFAAEHPEICQAIYTLGMPRFGGRRLCEAVDRQLNLYRIVNENDWAPQAIKPPFYRHAGQLVLLDAELGLLHEPSQRTQIRSRRQSRRRYLKSLFTDAWSQGRFGVSPFDCHIDHSPLRYNLAVGRIDED